MHELLALDEQLRSIRGSLKVEVAKRVQLEECVKKEKRKLKEIRDSPEYDNEIRENFRCRIDKLNDDLSVRQESIDLLKSRLTNQITSFTETIAKVLDKTTSLAKNIRTLFGERQIMIASTLMAIGMAIGVLVKALLPSGGGGGGISHTSSFYPTNIFADFWISGFFEFLLSCPVPSRFLETSFLGNDIPTPILGNDVFTLILRNHVLS